MAKSKKKSTENQNIQKPEKEIKNDRMSLRLPTRVKNIIFKKAKACNISANDFVITSALDSSKGGQINELKAYAVVTLAQDLINHVNEYYNKDGTDDELKRLEDALWEKLQ